GLSLDLSVPNYCAWFAPGIRGFMDYRFPLVGFLSADLMQVKRGLSELLSETSDPTDYAGPLRKHKINYLIASTDIELSRRELAMQLMLVEDDEWSLWYHNGRMAILGWRWRDTENLVGAPAKDPLRMDLVAMGLGDKAERLKPGDAYDVVRTAPPETQL